jgi:transcriptional regulator with XRE-family HTH domain
VERRRNHERKCFMIDPIDAHVGRVLRARREERGMSQGALGKAGDVSFQQVQKYEKGKNRVSASMLHKFAKALEMPISQFFPD